MQSNKTFLWAALVVVVIVLCVCVFSRAQHPTPDLYRFSVIRLAKGAVIDTQDGKYIALSDERWFSEAQCLALQRENSALHFQLNQSRHLRQ